MEPRTAKADRRLCPEVSSQFLSMRDADRRQNWRTVGAAVEARRLRFAETGDQTSSLGRRIGPAEDRGKRQSDLLWPFAFGRSRVTKARLKSS